MVRDVIRPDAAVPYVSLQCHPESLGVCSKTGLFDDGVVLDRPIGLQIGPAVLALARRTTADSLLFECSYADVCSKLREAVSFLGLEDTSFHRLRHGGASHDRAHKGN